MDEGDRYLVASNESGGWGLEVRGWKLGVGSWGLGSWMVDLWIDGSAVLERVREGGKGREYFGDVGDVRWDGCDGSVVFGWMDGRR